MTLQLNLKRLFWLLAAVGVFLLLGPAGHSDDAVPNVSNVPKMIHIAEIGGQNGKPLGAGFLTLAKEKGFFDDEFKKDGITFEFRYYVGTGPAINEALAQGNADLGTYGGVPNVIGLAGGIPAHVVLTRHSRGSSGYYIAVQPGSPIQTVADLRGKRISVQKGTNPYAALIRFLEKNGLTEKDVKLVNLQNAEALAAFNAGALDAVTGSSGLLVLRDQQKVRLVGPAGGIADETNVSGYLVNDAFAQKYPDVVARLVKVIVKTAWWASQEENRAELIAFFGQATVGGQKYAEEQYAGPLRQRFSPLLDGEALDGFRNIVSFGIAHKLVRGDAQFNAGWFEPKYLDAALKDLHLETYWSSVPAPTAVAASP